MFYYASAESLQMRAQYFLLIYLCFVSHTWTLVFILSFFKKKFIYSFWLHSVLVAVLGIFMAACRIFCYSLKAPLWLQFEGLVASAWGSHPHLRHWEVDSSPLDHQGSLWTLAFLLYKFLCTVHLVNQLSLEFICSWTLRVKAKRFLRSKRHLRCQARWTIWTCHTFHEGRAWCQAHKKSQGLANADSSSGSKGALSSAEEP